MRWLRALFLALVIAVGSVYLFPGAFLPSLGRYLVRTDDPVKSDCLFVLAGDQNGQRIMKAVDLYRGGLAPKLFISGPGGIYGHTEDELAIGFAKAQGASDIPFIPLPHRGRSTVEEGQLVQPALRQAGCRSVIVVTSDFHTRRAGRILRSIWQDMEVRMVASPTYDYDAEAWWTDRNYRKTFLLEWTKTVTSWFGM